MEDFLRHFGEIPLPPYIRRDVEQSDFETYQTVFARVAGAVAAPTAGLHFTQELLEYLKKQGIQTVYVTLHVGPGTFKPVTAENIKDHHMDAEWFDIPEKSAMQINAAKAKGRRIVAVGTTAVRTLETSAVQQGIVQAGNGDTRLFITPGFEFKVVDAILTNFHFPRTTLIMLVSAFAGRNRIRAAYQEAIKERYRFYSYGDLMFIE
jgi:S-adenosylmethionine:tRNA ribosyltransferase-isomerase